MKLQDALKKIIREFGMSVLREKRLVFLLSDYKAFDDYPSVKQIMKSIAEDGYGKELCRLGMDGSSGECLNYAGRLKKTLSGDKHFKPELADYAVDCVLFSVGFVSSVREPSDHGFDPFGNGSASHEQGIQKDSDYGHKNETQAGAESAEDWYRLGMSYANGSGVNQNYSMAVEYWRKAAELGHSGAQRRLGFAYAHGQGVVHDNAAALMWYRKAAAQGDSIARLELNSLLGDIQRSHEQSAGMTSAAGSPEKARWAVGIQRKSVSQAADLFLSIISRVCFLCLRGWFRDEPIGRAEFWSKLSLLSLLWSLLFHIPWKGCKLVDDCFRGEVLESVRAILVILFLGACLSLIVRRGQDLGYDSGFCAFCSGVFAFSLLCLSLGPSRGFWLLYTGLFLSSCFLFHICFFRGK